MQGAQLENGFSAGQAPACAGDAESILDEVPTGTFDDTGGDRKTVAEKFRVTQIPGILVQVFGAFSTGSRSFWLNPRRVAV